METENTKNEQIAFIIQEKVDELLAILRDRILCPMLWHI